MAHFAKLENDLVSEVIVVANIDVNNLPFPASEPIGQAFIASLGLTGLWLETSYNSNFRATYAGMGFSFDPTLGEYGSFIAPPIEPII